MQCPKCLNNDTKVLDSRVATDGYAIRRRRECAKCKFRFSTLEQMEILDLIVVKRNGERQPYSKEKLVAGLKRALEKRPITQDAFKKLVAAIEQEISNSTSDTEITSAQIGDVVMKQLKKMDQVAYIRFASVYRQFSDVEEFKKELRKL
ncbi:MAG: transcriptional regulator NrdR [Candidatus Doudnabacteria bacterium RIFCSPHIGHO2_01_FULL_50_11]|uniref:Transcriptional repressor NrdR n=1 Tax=Candidatus Doudnabacteria bacterium RIFCSPHIGHO2_01_FULL_50_11 TaxID=1817828 RepID=A0A1F5PJ05_9BACT|nr:MAG: transcriptional regulator NrdR [Candidatus Doudnabacteria bacterium RIFCSPHIGHO2_01_FULL_50_11]HLC44361.1 transcriptional regulator NrdR [Patescibacteria group bacterium]